MQESSQILLDIENSIQIQKILVDIIGVGRGAGGEFLFATDSFTVVGILLLSCIARFETFVPKNVRVVPLNCTKYTVPCTVFFTVL